MTLYTSNGKKKHIQVGDKGSRDFITTGDVRLRDRYVKWALNQGKDVYNIEKPTFWSLHFSHGQSKYAGNNVAYISELLGRKVYINGELATELANKELEFLERELHFVPFLATVT